MLNSALEWGIRKFFCNILVLVGWVISVPTTQLCLCSMKAAIGDTDVNAHGCVPTQLQTEVVG